MIDDPLKLDFLLGFEAEESRRASERVSRTVSDGVVTNIRALYDDRIYIPDGCTPAFHRNGTPLYALPFIARRIVAFFSPKKQAAVEHDLRTPWPVALELARAGILFPIVAWPKDYGSEETAYLRPLFDSTVRTTVSMPVRGYKMVDLMGANRFFEQARRDSRLSELATLPQLKEKWATQFPTAAFSDDRLKSRVLTELHNNFVDLCIYGYEEVAMAAIEEPDPTIRAQTLLQSSELLTYPSLIGLDGRAQYRMNTRKANDFLVPEIEPRFVNLPVVQAILDGIDLNLVDLVQTPSRYIQAVQRVHEAGIVEEIERLHDRLVELIGEASDVEDDRLNAAAKDLTDQLCVAKQEVESVAKTIGDKTAHYHKMAAIGVGTGGALATLFMKQMGQVGLEFAAMGAAASAGSAAYVQHKTPRLHDFLRTKVARRTLQKAFAFDLWSIRSRLRPK
jgi:hypothetical protein